MVLRRIALMFDPVCGANEYLSQRRQLKLDSQNLHPELTAVSLLVPPFYHSVMWSFRPRYLYF